jgi:hypothetical protein
MKRWYSCNEGKSMMLFDIFKKPDTNNASSLAPAETVTDDTKERPCAMCLREQGITPTEGSHGYLCFSCKLDGRGSAQSSCAKVEEGLAMHGGCCCAETMGSKKIPSELGGVKRELPQAGRVYL